MSNTVSSLTKFGMLEADATRFYTQYGNSVWNMLSNRKGLEEMCEIARETHKVRKASLAYAQAKSKTFFATLPFSTERKYKIWLSLDKYSPAKRLYAFEKNPYSCIYDARIDFVSLDEYCISQGEELISIRRIKAALFYALLLFSSSADESIRLPKSLSKSAKTKIENLIQTYAGSTCIDYINLSKVTAAICGIEDDSLILDACTELHVERKISVVSDDGKMFVYLYDIEQAEYNSANYILDKINEPCPYSSKDIYAEIRRAQAKMGVMLSHEQVEAAYTTLSSPVSIITGGPGTGKTATLKIILEAYERLSHGKNINLLAPTGQAARRATEATGRPATTIHKALHLIVGKQQIVANNVRLNGMVVVDEASMLDAILLEKLLSSVEAGCKILLQGDVDQLPSIGAGNVLSELIDAIPTSRLTKVFRQADDSEIAFNAARIKTGTPTMLEGKDFHMVNVSGKSEQVQKKVVEIYKKEASERGAENVIVLTPYRKYTPTGVNELNDVLRKAVGVKFGKCVSVKGLKLYEGDKVMHLRNKDGLTNGDVGTLETIKPNGCWCNFNGKKYFIEDLEFLQPAYAQTIHKSQGSQYHTVIVIVDNAHANMLSKNLVYTGLTRATDNAFMVYSNQDTFDDIIIKGNKNRRISHLKKAISAA